MYILVLCDIESGGYSVCCFAYKNVKCEVKFKFSSVPLYLLCNICSDV
jgi:hypothetical protein